ncbi:Y-family DNA polymerase [Prochlorococcus marinus]|uniref:DNA polymerase V subunit UmuC n=1 Tax=Prochlorococcus marinus XMU1408 TaxID=2213228 RepID=A0A318R4D9_PROMR|nr:Y-family DNA polymerase [Prochlorococcus marinus]MBW3041903.1 DNA polymerase V subunit UmuC [Prochlorococcus marinus str. XMU1408]PYE03034.1 DNA polymerase V subunit UmuC [Prochlorococcus marinus XMU1408]
MRKAIVQIDGNNFYASCEQMIDPSIRGKALVILSNNDGCIIARSSEARKMGIPMGQPYFKLKSKLNQLNINVRSSNYELYGDVSNRLMQILKENCEELEIYSIDEAFATMKRPKDKCLYQWGKDLRALVYQNIGIPISIGIGETKVLSKISNYIAKEIQSNSGIFDIGIVEDKNPYLQQIKVDKVWGVGKKMSTWLKVRGINNARELRDMSSNQIKSKYGVIGLRIQNELKGTYCIPINEKSSARKEICVSRSFAYPIDSLEELSQSISKYVLIATAKLRKYNQLSSAITVFTTTNTHSKDFYRSEASIKLQTPSSNSIIIQKNSIELTNRIFKPYKKFIKAGVILHNLSSNQYKQKLLFCNNDLQEEFYLERLNSVIDNINKKNGKDLLGWGSSIIEREWRPRRSKLSGSKVTNIESIPTVFAN